MARSHMAATPVPCLEEARSTGGVMDVSGLALHLRGGCVVVLSAYLRPTIGTAGENLRRLADLLALVRGFKVDWVIYADWNATPRQLAQTGWLRDADGVLWTPSEVQGTCRSGQGRMLDYVVTSQGAGNALDGVSWEPRGLWASHKTLRLRFRRTLLVETGSVLALPRPFPRAERPQALPDPHSKAPRRRALAELKKEQYY